MPEHSHHHHGDGAAGSASEKTAKDPVCGMTVDPRTPHQAVHAGRTYHFCSGKCRERFVAEPEQFLSPPARPTSSDGAIYTCPMHPDVRQVGPGACPICGMALEPEAPTQQVENNPELADMTRRFWIGLLLTAPVFLLEMGGHLTGLHFGGRFSALIQFALATPVVLWCGWPFLQRGWRSLISRNLNMFTLVAMGVGVAWTYSVMATLAPDLFPPAFRTHDGAVPIYFEAAAVITVLVLLGQVLELRARA